MRRGVQGHKMFDILNDLDKLHWYIDLLVSIHC